MDICKELYYGWLVLAVLEDNCWMFECHRPEGKTYIDGMAYQTSAQAMNAAKEFVQRDTAETALLQALSS